MPRGLRRIAVAAVVWSWILILAVAAALIGDSLVFPFRGRLTLLIVGLAISLAVLRGGRLSSAVLVLVTAGAVWQWASPMIARHEVWADLEDARIVGRHFVVGYTDIEQVRDLSRAGLIGGVFLTRRNVEGRTLAEVAAEIAGLQVERKRAGLPPLIVAGDQEGGPVSHLSPPLPPLPALSLLAGLDPGLRRAAARHGGVEAGLALAAVGVTMDLAPVVDLRPGTARSALDLHTRLGTRAISGDPDAVTEIAAEFSAGLRDSGVMPTAKHFPGLGSVSTDTHIFGATLTRARASLEAADWRPFRALLAVPGTAVMLSHASLEAVDPGVPASQSRAVVADLLRREWGFDGIVITDDLTMGAVIHAGLCQVVERSLQAGVDLLLVSWDTDRIYPALHCAAEAVRAGRLDAAILAPSALRLDRAPVHPGA